MNGQYPMNNKQYNAPITRKTPSMFLFVVDCSSSMADMVIFAGNKTTKANAVSRIINTTLQEIASRCKREDGYRNYFDLGVMGYFDDRTEMLLDYLAPGKDFCSITELTENEVEEIEYETRRILPDGKYFITSTRIPNIIHPISSGTTPMGKAFKKAYTITKNWITAHKGLNCFPPVIINISDGEYTDTTEMELKETADKIKSLHTENGNVLLFNIHLSHDTGKEPVIFPISEKELNKEDRYANLLYNLSSELPDTFFDGIAMIKGLPRTAVKQAKAMGYNSSMTELMRMINIGSVSITRIG